MIAAADAKLSEGFKAAVGQTAQNLRADYVDSSTLRQQWLIRVDSLGSTSSDLVNFIHEWFDSTWPRLTEEQKNKKDDRRTIISRASIDACAGKLGLGPTIAGKKNPSYEDPTSLDNVDKKCGVREALPSFIKGKIGSIH